MLHWTLAAAAAHQQHLRQRGSASCKVRRRHIPVPQARPPNRILRRVSKSNGHHFSETKPLACRTYADRSTRIRRLLLGLCLCHLLLHLLPQLLHLLLLVSRQHMLLLLFCLLLLLLCRLWSTVLLLLLWRRVLRRC